MGQLHSSCINQQCISASEAEDIKCGPVDTFEDVTSESPVLRSLICDLEEGLSVPPLPAEVTNGRIPKDSFRDVWRQLAEHRSGKLSRLELETIKETTATFLEVAPVDAMGSVDPFKLSMYIFRDPSAGPLKALRTRLRSFSDKNPEELSVIFRLFRSWDQEGKGVTSPTELGLCLLDLGRVLGLPDALLANANTEVLRLVECKANGTIDFWQAIALILGRRFKPVEILLYDLSGGASDTFSVYLLGQHFEAIYHSSLLVFGEEFWYGGKIWRSHPPQFDAFGPPLSTSVAGLKRSSYLPELNVIHMGFTLATHTEFTRWLAYAASRYKCENYDVLNWNCNHFTDEAAQFLTGNPLPESVQHLAEHVNLTLSKVPILRPLVNKWLAGSSASAGSMSYIEEDIQVLKPNDAEWIEAEIPGENPPKATDVGEEDLKPSDIGEVAIEKPAA